MRLGDFLKKGAEAPTHPVQFQIVGKDAQEVTVRATASAVLAFVDESSRQQSRLDARAHLTALDAAPSDDELIDERICQILFRSMRDADDPRKPFAQSVDELRRALVLVERNRLYLAYSKFVEDEFPDTCSPDALKAMETEAAGK